MDKKTAVLIGFALELPAMIIAGVFIGRYFDNQYALNGMAIAGGAFIGFASWVTHFVLVLRDKE